MHSDPVEALNSHIESVPFFDTHSHMAGMDAGSPLNDRGQMNLPRLLIYDYLLYMAGACWDECDPLQPDRYGIDAAEAHFMAIEPLLDLYRAQGTWAVLREGIRLLHPFEEPDITRDNWRPINDSIVRAYKEHGERAWQRQVRERMGVSHQVHFCILDYVTEHWGSLTVSELERQQEWILPSLVLDGFLFSGFAQHGLARERAYGIVGVGKPGSLSEYHAFCAKVMARFVAAGGRAVKLLTAYCRDLAFEPCSNAEAGRLFAKGPENLPPPELARLQGNLLRHLLKLAIENNLPLSIHTGYATPTAYGDPERLLFLFHEPELHGLKVDLCHSGWPNSGGAVIMARTFRHCYFNLCWTPMLSPTLGKRLLREAIDMLPMNKILIGTDCATAEAFAGTVQMTRRLLAQTLAEMIEGGHFDLSVAKTVATAILYTNPRAVFGRG